MQPWAPCRDFGYSPPLPPEPTEARPGSPEKVELLRRRLEMGVALWHPDDQACFRSAVDLTLRSNAGQALSSRRPRRGYSIGMK